MIEYTGKELEYKFWRLEKWWISFDNYDMCSPKNRVRLFGNWFWRK